jgi:hypothetical protein
MPFPIPHESSHRPWNVVRFARLDWPDAMQCNGTRTWPMTYLTFEDEALLRVHAAAKMWISTLLGQSFAYL